MGGARLFWPDPGEVIRAGQPKRLPVVMTREEAKAVLGYLRDDTWLMAALTYGAGLRSGMPSPEGLKTSASSAAKLRFGCGESYEAGQYMYY